MDLSPQLVDPLDASRHPFETYLLCLAAVSGVPLLFGKANSGSMAAAMPEPAVLAWGAMLVLGSLLALVGLYWHGKSATGLLLERTGLVGVGGAAIIFSAVALLSVGLDATFSACITAGFGLACFAQARRISHRIRLVLNRIDQIERGQT